LRDNLENFVHLKNEVRTKMREAVKQLS
jgi:hypothetical protein